MSDQNPGFRVEPAKKVRMYVLFLGLARVDISPELLSMEKRHYHQRPGVDILQKKSKNAQGGKNSAQAKFG